MQQVVKPLVKFLLATPILRAVTLLVFGTLLGYIAWSLWAQEINYSLSGTRTTATVEKYRSGKFWSGTTDVTHEVDGETVKAWMSTWGPSVHSGEQIAALYLPDHPKTVARDTWWRYALPALFSWIPLLALILGVRYGVEDVRALMGSTQETVEYAQSEEGHPVEEPGVPIDAGTALKVGSKVLAFEQDRWWRAEVVGLQPGDIVRLHFPGWDAKWDREVPRSELHLEPTTSIPAEQPALAQPRE
jgi:hypothetical protein